MRRRHPSVPQLWLMTDERMGDALWAALERLPRGSGVVFRHYTLSHEARRALFARVARIAQRRDLVLLRAGSRSLGEKDGTHGTRRPPAHGLWTRPAHSRSEALRAQRQGADAIFVSPVYPTRSHPGAMALGRARFGLLIRGVKVPVIALGGMDGVRAQALMPFGIHGWAGIDVWMDA